MGLNISTLQPAALDDWDPNNWVDDHEYRIYGSANLELYAIVDAIDYIELCKYRWSLHDPKKLNHPYLRRATHVTLAPEGPPYVSEITGKLVRNRKRIQYNLFLHTAVMLRTGIAPPSPDHDEVDHLDRNVLNCRRYNLVWATREMQLANRAITKGTLV